MKFNYILLIAIILSSFSCEPEVVFGEAQPQGLRNKSKINKAYRGTFFCEGDETVVTIGKKCVVKSKDFAIGIPMEDIDNNDKLMFKKNELIVIPLNESFPAFYKNDSVFSEIKLRDTLFNISEENVLKDYKGHLVLNHKLESDNWEVIILSVNEYGDIGISEAFRPEDLELLKKITPVEEIPIENDIQIKISPDYEAFERIISDGLIFKTCDYFYRTEFPSIEI